MIRNKKNFGIKNGYAIPPNKMGLYKLIGDYIEDIASKGGVADIEDYRGGRPVTIGYNPKTDEIFICSNGPLNIKGWQPGGVDCIYVPDERDVLGTCELGISEYYDINRLYGDIEYAIGEACRMGIAYYESLEDDDEEILNESIRRAIRKVLKNM